VAIIVNEVIDRQEIRGQSAHETGCMRFEASADDPVKAANYLAASIAPGNPALPSKQVLDERGTDIRSLDPLQTKFIGADLHNR
jgi:hypothetical protein